ncbi:MAG: hypothetical protein CR986_10140 [Ignavibacteriae bacterium]|nr:MAG: hypothetical protein CR986_10140 [Ignavibacteriota bacterium]
MKKTLLLSLTILSIFTYAQTGIFIPRNIQEAIANKTRTLIGLPGENYWINKAEYKIEASVLPDSSYLIGNEIIKYQNNSPDTLNKIIVRLYQDIGKVNALRDWYIGKQTLTDEVKINYIIIDNDTIDISHTSKSIYRGSTNLIIYLKNKILPDSNTEIKIGWEFEIPKQFKIRMGNYGNGDMYVAYWYPEIAVFDDIDGWDMIDYQGSVEFYNDFSNFDIKINVPKGVVVWSTGNLLNAEETLRKDIYKKYKKAKTSDQVIKILTQEDYAKGLVTTEKEINTWHFYAENVPAVAFAISKSCNWDGTSALVDSSSGKRVLTDVVYPDSTVNYENGAQISKETIEYLSHKIPGFPYPYSHATIFCNGNRNGGMESPMMANNGAPSSEESFIGLLSHEISHNYFPFLMGTNERKYAWMDEGWATYLPTELIKKHLPESHYREYQLKKYEKLAGTERDLPLITPSFSYKTGLARLGFYNKPFTAYFELYEYLGKNLFKKCMQEYVKRWIGKHPIPYDFFFTFNEVAGENLFWFWKPWFFEQGYPDLSIESVKNTKDMTTIKIKMLGTLPTRVILKLEFKDGTVINLDRPMNVWKNGNNSINVSLKTTKKIKQIVLGNNTIPDVNRTNNIYTFN